MVDEKKYTRRTNASDYDKLFTDKPQQKTAADYDALFDDVKKKPRPEAILPHPLYRMVRHLLKGALRLLQAMLDNRHPFR